MKELFDEAEVRKTLAAIISERSEFEIRALSAQLKGERRRGTVSGYFDNADSCVTALRKLAEAKGIYVTLNPVNPALLSRCANRLAYAEKDGTTKDHDVLWRRWLLLDVDYQRPTGISATDEEKKAARRKAKEIVNFFKDRGWHEPLVADSGNGFHLLLRINQRCGNDGLIEKAIAALADRFDGDDVKLDRTVFNPARIVRLYGTLAAKGDDTKDRPHRTSKILKAPLLKKVSAEQLRALVEELQPTEENVDSENVGLRHGAFDVEQFLARYGVKAEKTTETDGTIKWTLAQCPFNADHKSPDAAVFQYSDGRLGFKCFHNSCVDKRWQDFRRHFEPATTGKDRRDDNTNLTSLSSLGLVEYPAPLGQAAYHGLAGDIVRRIEPHTEADSAALLIQTLTAFGSVIGRNAHALADASRHAGNLFAVLVGETSKARKGTAWAHVRRLFKRADAGWAQDCIVNGLSSGEGVIWAVRDPISKTSENGTEIVDAGIADKRLCVVEGEFANVLKVMTREGNTLSPVIRAAWDSGNLRSLTKNSPARATGAHVSIIGHITKGELRRLLTETESANGFANRFLPLAARRSKCLPEGGNIGSDSMNDLVARLQKAIEFARYAGEVARSDEARALWARIYPKLSEGKPGLLGAITARAEAQVLRLSVTYALLDSSSKVEVQHLNAALALWDYCERSAAWAFEMGTGNKNADKILSALKAAGRNGMTKWEITANVFNRNATKHEIDEALRLLHHLKLASPKLEKTGGRSAERWVYQATKHEEYEETEETDRKREDTSYSSSPRGSGTANTSFSSSPQPSQDASSAERDTEVETLVAVTGEPENEAVSDVVSGHLQVVSPEPDPTPNPAEEHPTDSGENLPPGRLIL